MLLCYYGLKSRTNFEKDKKQAKRKDTLKQKQEQPKYSGLAFCYGLLRKEPQ
jgi:hypothetical protein